ncbi:MAG: S-adenosyl-l-methionine hydroxide adenosyltransferase family protein [Xanthomonadales bacterium]|nr:S-adenosyl-l-methionine hydroxide adenosyltransferase family protein [Xanthomonadales bacterium]
MGCFKAMFQRLCKPRRGGRHLALVAAAILGAGAAGNAFAAALVLQSDFGLRDGAVAAMKGVALSVAPDIPLHDLTHEVPPYDIWEAALRLEQVAAYWPAGTVFVSVVDPGVGTDRRSVVMQTRSGHYFVTPDNGTLTFVARSLGVEAVREIDEAVNRRRDSQASYTFHGRDVYAYTGARLAAGIIGFDEVGPDLEGAYVALPFQAAECRDDRCLGTVILADVRYGNLWTNIGRALFERLGAQPGDRLALHVRHGEESVLRLELPYQNTFGAVPVGDALLYLNSLGNVAFAINQGSFATVHGIGSGPGWSVEIARPR